MKKRTFFACFIFCLLNSPYLLAQTGTPKSTEQQILGSDEKFISVGNLKFRDFNKNGKLDIYEDYRQSIEKRANDLLQKMTIEEKLVQLQSPWIGKAKIFKQNKFDFNKAKDAFPNGLGEILQLSHGNGVLNVQKTPVSADVAVLANQTQNYFINGTRLGIPVLFLEEALHGLMIKDGTMFPTSLGMSCSWNEELTTQVFDAIAKEARAIGTHRVLAPVIDLAMDPRWGRTEETMGEDPYLTSRLGVAKVKALQGNTDTPDSNHVAANLKHFGAHGTCEGGSNAGPSFISERELREIYFKPFRAAIVEGKALGIMPNYNEISGIPVHSNKWMLTDILRKEWGFKGIIESDLMAVAELNNKHHIVATNSEAGAKALNAGVDIELCLTDACMDSLPAAIKRNQTTMNDLNSAVLKVLEMKFRLGLFEHPYINTKNTGLIGLQAHRDLALKAARQSIVLLKNDNNILPLDRKKIKRIAVIGPNADECNLGGYSQFPRTSISPLQALKEKYKDVEFVYAEGCRLTPTGDRRAKAILPLRAENLKLIQQAVEIAKNVDAIVVMLGSNNIISREATGPETPGDLANLELLGDQNELVDSLSTLKKPLVAFVFSGPPISCAHLNKTVPAVVQCWYLGQETGYAVAETLFGINNPTGKLSISIPRSAGHLPDYYYVKPSARINTYNMDSISALYPFGYGLSYTTYQYTNLRIEKEFIRSNENVVVSIDVKNTGKVVGEEIVQLYIRDEVSSVTRPVKELKDFKRIPLNPGETKTVNFTITPDKLKFYDLNMKEVIEPGVFDIMVGASSRNYNTIKLNVL
jgi:beta-glucosidase